MLISLYSVTIFQFMVYDIESPDVRAMLEKPKELKRKYKNRVQIMAKNE